MALETSRTTRYHGLTTFSHKKMVETNTSMEDIHILYPPGVNLFESKVRKRDDSQETTPKRRLPIQPCKTRTKYRKTPLNRSFLEAREKNENTASNHLMHLGQGDVTLYFMQPEATLFVRNNVVIRAVKML